MCLQNEKPIENSQEALFEDILRQISVEAFEALITCGVRDINGFLGLTIELLISAGIKTCITSELMDLQQQVNAQLTHEEDNTIAEETAIVLAGGDQTSEDATGRLARPTLEYRAEEFASIISRKPKSVPVGDVQSATYWTAQRTPDMGAKRTRDVGVKRSRDVGVKRTPNLGVKRTPAPEPDLANRHERRTVKLGQGRPFFYPRTLDFSRLGEKKPSDPAGWSLLARTLPDIFRLHQLAPPGKDPTALDDNLTLISLNISLDELEGFRAVALFPEDSADSVLSLTIGYLLEANPSESVFSIILDYCARYIGQDSPSALTIPMDNISEEAILSGLPIDEIAELQVMNLPDDIALVMEDQLDSPFRWKDIALLSERNIIDRLGFTIRGMKAIQQAWRIKDRALHLYQEISKGLPVNAYTDFETLVDSFVHSVARNERESTVLKGRLGVLDGRKWTLEELSTNQ